MQNPRVPSRVIFYVLIIASILITLFLSILFGLILLVAVIVYYTWKARAARTISPTGPSDGTDSEPGT